jgi:hypothetical protein
MVFYTLRPLYRREIIRYSFNKKLGGPIVGLGALEKINISMFLLEFEPRIV